MQKSMPGLALSALQHDIACKPGNLQQLVSSQAPFLLVRPGRRSLEGEGFGKWTRSGIILGLHRDDIGILG